MSEQVEDFLINVRSIAKARNIDRERIADLLKYKKTGSGKLADRIVKDVAAKGGKDMATTLKKQERNTEKYKDKGTSGRKYAKKSKRSSFTREPKPTFISSLVTPVFLVIKLLDFGASVP